MKTNFVTLPALSVTQWRPKRRGSKIENFNFFRETVNRDFYMNIGTLTS